MVTNLFDETPAGPSYEECCRLRAAGWRQSVVQPECWFSPDAEPRRVPWPEALAELGRQERKDGEP